VSLHHKDLTICQQMAAQLGGELPTVDTTQAQYQILMAEGHGEEDIAALYRLNRRLFQLPENT
jgi:3-hydroxyisobutyrate dehydrogenase